MVNVIKAARRRQLMIAGLHTEVCVARPVIQAAGEGLDMTVITHASGEISKDRVSLQQQLLNTLALKNAGRFPGADTFLEENPPLAEHE